MEHTQYGFHMMLMSYAKFYQIYQKIYKVHLKFSVALRSYIHSNYAKMKISWHDLD
jgi:hypothetical protein